MVACQIPDCIPPISGNASHLDQVFLNLLICARDALESAQQPASHITVSVEELSLEEKRVTPSPAGNYLGIHVTDDGTGMDEITRQRVFEPFFTTKEVGHGTGLGLATAYAIVEQHGGWMECRSQPADAVTQVPGETLLRKPYGMAEALATIRDRLDQGAGESVAVQTPSSCPRIGEHLVQHPEIVVGHLNSSRLDKSRQTPPIVEQRAQVATVQFKRQFLSGPDVQGVAAVGQAKLQATARRRRALLQAGTYSFQKNVGILHPHKDHVVGGPIFRRQLGEQRP